MAPSGVEAIGEQITVFHGHVKNGRIELDRPVALPEGADVEVTVSRTALGPGKNLHVPQSDESRRPTIAEELACIAGEVPESEWANLPADLNEHLDRYLYGTLKQ